MFEVKKNGATVERFLTEESANVFARELVAEENAKQNEKNEFSNLDVKVVEIPDIIRAFYELSPRYDSRKSFYGKAHVIEYTNGKRALQSYNTVVSVEYNGEVKSLGWYSNTTSRHQREFERQFAH